ncbi:hypothetical protein L345_07761, partial [Ophiophagus hannah]
METSDLKCLPSFPLSLLEGGVDGQKEKKRQREERKEGVDG